jgi:hypothetical protein
VTKGTGRFDKFKVQVRRSIRNYKRFVRSHKTTSLDSRTAVNFALVGAIVLSGISPVLPALSAIFDAQQAKIAKPIADTQPTSELAADAQPVEGSAAPISPSLQSQLDADRQANTVGKKDRTPVASDDSKRTLNDKVTINADGTKTLTHTLQASSYKDAAGNWKDVDNTLVQANGKWENKGNSWKARFGASNTSGIELSSGTQTLVMKPVGGANVTPSFTAPPPKP